MDQVEAWSGAHLVFTHLARHPASLERDVSVVKARTGPCLAAFYATATHALVRHLLSAAIHA
jgi:hypothetical protein